MPLDEDLEDYESTLGDLRTNSKPNINALTLLAEDYRNKDHSLAEGVVRLIETRLQKVVPTQKLPLMYLLDSIVKNVGEPYRAMFTEKIVATFCNTFERVDQTTRAKLYKLRTTWNTLFPIKMLASIDSKIKAMDPSWPLDPQSSQIAAAAAAGGSQLGSQGGASTVAGGGGSGGMGTNVPTSNNNSTVASTNIHINPRVYPHFPLTNQLGSNPAMYYGHPTPAAVSTQNVGNNAAGQSESRDPRLRGKTAPAPVPAANPPNIQQTKTAILNPPTNVTPALQATNHVAMTTGSVVNTFPYAAVQPMTTTDMTGTDQSSASMFPFFAMQPPPAQMPVAGMVSAQMPGGAIVQLTPEQLKAAAAVAPIPGVEPTPVKGPDLKATIAASIAPTTAVVKPMVKRVGVGGKMNKTGEQKKKAPKQQPKRPLSPWRTKRASPPNFMREDRSVSPDRERDRTSSPSGSERRRADSEGKRKRPSGNTSTSGSQDQDVGSESKDTKSGPVQRGRSSSPGPVKKKNNMTESPKRDKEDKPDDIKYGSNVPAKKNKDSASSASDTEKSDASKKPAESEKSEPSPTKKVSQPPARRPIGRAQAEVAAKLLGKRGNNNQKSLKPIPPKNPRLSVMTNGQNKQKKSAEEGFIPIKDDVQVGKKDVDYRGIRGAATSASSSTAPASNSTTSTGGQSIRVAGVRKVGTGVPEVITPEQVYARAEMLLKSGKLTSQQCKELEEQIKEVQRRREKDTEKKASTDYDMRRPPGQRPGPNIPARRPVINPNRWPANHRGPPPPPPTSGDRRFGPPPRVGSGPPLRGPDSRSFRHPPPPHFLANQRGPPPPRGANQIPYKGPPPPNFRGAPRMPPDPRWRNVGPPRFPPNPRDGMAPQRDGAAPPPPNMPMRPPQFVMNRPPTAPMPPRPPEFPAPPKPNQADIPRNLPPTEVYQFGPGYGYSPEWDRYYDQHGLGWPKEMPFDPRFAGAQIQNRPRVPPSSGPPLPGTGPMLGATPRPLEPMNVGTQMNQPGQVPGGAAVPLSTSGAPLGPAVPVPEPVSLDESNVDLSSLFNRLIDMGMISSSSTLAEDTNDSSQQEGGSGTVTSQQAGGDNQHQLQTEQQGANEDEDDDESMRFKPPDADTEPLADIANISFDNETLKEYQFGVIQRMYRGLQCSSCGMRYPIDKQSQYTAHLDWHFRQKKRKADGYVGSSREWFPICEDWFVLSDHADRLSAGFGEESAANEMMRTSANDNVMSNENSVEAEKMSVCADSKIPNDEICKICREYFEQFWHVTAEEWHFLDAIRVEGKTVHFFCYKEFTDNGNGTAIPSTPRTISMESTTSESNQSANKNLNDPNYEPNKTPLKEPNANNSAQAVENSAPSSSTTNRKEDETAKPQHSLSSLNSILNNLTGDKEAGFSEIVAHQSDDDSDCVIRIKEEPKDLSVETSTNKSGETSEGNNTTTSSSAEGKGTKESPVLIRIKDEPMDESEMELQVQQHRSR